MTDQTQWIGQLRDDLSAARGADGGWPYHLGLASSTEPTALAILALSPPHADCLAAGDWLTARQRDDGLFTASVGHHDSSGLTPLAALALGLLGRQARVDAAVSGLLAENVFSLDSTAQAGLYGFDTGLRGWPWRGEDFSFVEPTALAVILLKRQGRGDLPRVREAVSVLRDRALAAGGWNYGEPRVLGGDLYPTIVPTALALLALADEPDAGTAAALNWLHSQRGRISSLFSLGWAAIALNVLGQIDEVWRADLVDLWEMLPADRRGPLETSLCLLAMAPRDGHHLAVVLPVREDHESAT